MAADLPPRPEQPPIKRDRTEREHISAPPPELDPRSLGDLLGELVHETTTLLKQEVALAKTEIRREVKEAGVNAASIAAGGAVAYSGLIVLLMGAAFLLGTFMPLWLAFLLVGIVVALVGYALVQKGLSTLKEMDAKPDRTVETLKRDKEWLTQETQR